MSHGPIYHVHVCMYIHIRIPTYTQPYRASEELLSSRYPDYVYKTQQTTRGGGAELSMDNSIPLLCQVYIHTYLPRPYLPVYLSTYLHTYLPSSVKSVKNAKAIAYDQASISLKMMLRARRRPFSASALLRRGDSVVAYIYRWCLVWGKSWRHPRGNGSAPR